MILFDVKQKKVKKNNNICILWYRGFSEWLWNTDENKIYISMQRGCDLVLSCYENYNELDEETMLGAVYQLEWNEDD